MASPMVWMRMSPRVQAFEHLAPCCCYCLERLRRWGSGGSTFLLQRALRFEPVLSVHLSLVINYHLPTHQLSCLPLPCVYYTCSTTMLPMMAHLQPKPALPSSAFGHNALSHWKSSWECFPCFSFIYLRCLLLYIVLTGLHRELDTLAFHAHIQNLIKKLRTSAASQNLL